MPCDRRATCDDIAALEKMVMEWQRNCDDEMKRANDAEARAKTLEREKDAGIEILRRALNTFRAELFFVDGADPAYELSKHLWETLKEAADTPMRERLKLLAEVDLERIKAEKRAEDAERAIEPVRDWYDGDGERTDVAAMLRDAIEDLQRDRAEVLRLRNVERERDSANARAKWIYESLGANDGEIEPLIDMLKSERDEAVKRAEEQQARADGLQSHVQQLAMGMPILDVTGDGIEKDE